MTSLAAPSALAQTPPAGPDKPPAGPDKPPAAAQAPPSEAATRADALFQEGKKLLESGSFDAACELLAKSDSLDPTVSALGLLAACHEQQGKLATAWREYRETVVRAEAARDPRGDFARQRAAALEPRVPKIMVRVAHPTPGLEIRRDGVRLAEDALGKEVAVDPGPHEVVLTAPGRTEQRIRAIAKEGGLVTVEVPDLAPLPPPAPVAAPPPPPPPGLGPRLPIALAAGGVSLAGLALGAGFGVVAMNRNLDSKTVQATCRTADACAAGRDLRDGAYRAATISTIGFGVAAGGAVVTVVALLWPRSKPAASALQVTPLVGPSGGGAVVRATF
jgi:hypothetical protein